MLRWLFKKREPAAPIDPTDILVGLICQQIIMEPRHRSTPQGNEMTTPETQDGAAT